MDTGKNKHYQIIWRFLEHKLSAVEEEGLMRWLGEENRNQDFFDEVLQDYELFLGGTNMPVSLENGDLTKDNYPRIYHHWLIKVAAGIILILGLGYLFSLNIEKPNAITRTILLYDSTQIVLSTGSELIYDSARFPETHCLQIKGKARIIPPVSAESLLLLETDLGYYFSENAEFIIHNQPNKNLEIVMLSGEAQWLNLDGAQMELDVVPGEKLWVIREHGSFYKESIDVADKEFKSADVFKSNRIKLTI